MNQDAVFLRSLRAAPEDDTVRLIYADWLEEQGDPRGEYLRLDTAAARRRGRPASAQRHRLAELRAVLDREWVVTVSRSRHDAVKQLDVTIYPPSLRGRYKVREIEAPSWAEVEKSVRRLDRHRYPSVWLWLEEDADYKFDIVGGKGAYVMSGRLDDQEMRYHDPAGGDGYVDVWTSDQGYSAPEKDVCRDLETVVRVAKYVYYYGAFAPSVPWA